MKGGILNSKKSPSTKGVRRVRIQEEVRVASYVLGSTPDTPLHSTTTVSMDSLKGGKGKRVSRASHGGLLDFCMRGGILKDGEYSNKCISPRFPGRRTKILGHVRVGRYIPDSKPGAPLESINTVSMDSLRGDVCTMQAGRSYDKNGVESTSTLSEVKAKEQGKGPGERATARAKLATSTTKEQGKGPGERATARAKLATSTTKEQGKGPGERATARAKLATSTTKEQGKG